MNKKKIAIIAAVIVIIALAYYFLVYKKNKGLEARTFLKRLLPSDNNFTDVLVSLSDSEAIALAAWDAAGRPTNGKDSSGNFITGNGSVDSALLKMKPFGYFYNA